MVNALRSQDECASPIRILCIGFEHLILDQVRTDLLRRHKMRANLHFIGCGDCQSAFNILSS
ncbi:hypothetical protein BDV41DRAFT_537665 [Aspergillus transmontanensis]|uniref:Uncharacterized protein n=1 Tax=Aspergillus transmontanensis TaxID=1034304 RepID=A0A5N6VZ03_9EURO|nr:hypothetical protein BDV41DRAFT_537665 [Aspergillus transmontanensis]